MKRIIMQKLSIGAACFLIMTAGHGDSSAQELTPVVAPTAGGTFFLLSAEGEGGSPPYPFDPYAGVMPLYQLPGIPNSYLVADSVEDFQALQALQREMRLSSRSGMMSMNSLDFPGEGEEGEGGEGDGWEYIPIVYGSNDLWLEITNVAGNAADFIIHTPDEAAYDLFSTTNLALDVPGLNATNWVWLVRTDVGQTNVTITNLWPELGFFRLGTMLDSDSDGLTDAFENLVSHSDPDEADSDSDGMSDYYEWTHFGTMAQGAGDDFDGDGVGNLDEMNAGLNPTLGDTDGDGRIDELFRVQIQSPH